MGARNSNQVKLDCEWLIGQNGPIRYTARGTVDFLYIDIGNEYRYALGYNDYGELVVWDLYASTLSDTEFKIIPHFIETFEDMDHALAALTITYKNER